MHDNEEIVLQALRNGAVGYLLKGSDPAHAREAVRLAAAGRHYFNSSIAQRL